MNAEMSTTKENFIWEEKNLIGQEKNCFNNNVIEPKNIITDTKNDLTKKACVDIGKISGIYKIINKVNNKYYVGSSNNIYKRWRQHKSLLKRNEHYNSHLQHSWNKYGKENFDFIIVEEIVDDLLLITEQKYLDECKLLKNTYNMEYNAGGGELDDKTIEKMRGPRPCIQGKNHPMYGKQHSFKTKMKITLSLIGNKRNLNHRHTDETKLKLSKMFSGKNSPRYDNKVFKFKNKKTGEIFLGTKSDFKNRFNTNKVYGLTLGKRNSVKGWTLIN